VCLQDHWRFLSRLNSAITEQRERIDQQRRAVEQSLERWQEAQVYVAILEKVRERIRAADRRTLERKDQRVSDDRRHGMSDILAVDEA
jgi:flagellar export protein FliJ